MLPTVLVGCAVSCLISGGKVTRVWEKMEEYFSCFENWHENHGDRDLMFVGWVNNEVIV